MVGRKEGGDREEEKWGNRNSAPTIYVALGCCTTFVACDDIMDFASSKSSRSTGKVCAW
ncbi:hypothetical protein P692DRAFT_20831758 [Suillus brevipes Sb2]|nr:hypothetical protein P692DRAFT_20831758 [Suillus brevipes Sb2]